MNAYFANIITNLDIPQYSPPEESSTNTDPLIQMIDKYKDHPSIVAIRNKFKGELSFSFKTIEREELYKEILNLDTTKACQEADIPTKVIKLNADLFADFLSSPFNNCIKTGEFPSRFKLADITPIYKKGTKTSKDNYRPISILPNISKIFEKPIFKQVSMFFDKILSNFQCGFRKGYSTQHCLLAMLQKWKWCQDQGKSIGALLTDLSKAFDCLSHGLILAKLHAYGFDYNALKLIYSYLSGRFQRTKVGTSFSSWKDVRFGVPQGSILGPLLFNIFLCDLFFMIEDIEFASFADNTTPYSTKDCIDDVISSLTKASEDIFKWFSDNEMKVNPEKCKLIVNSPENVSLKLSDNSIESSNTVKLLGVEIDSNLTFKGHINSVCKKANQKLHALARI